MEPCDSVPVAHPLRVYGSKTD